MRTPRDTQTELLRILVDDRQRSLRAAAARARWRRRRLAAPGEVDGMAP